MTTDRQNGSLYTKIENKVATIEFGHPNANSFPLELLERLAQDLNVLSNNPEVAIILLKSEGDRAFCAGASFDELLAIETEAEGNRFFNGFANLFLAMRECKKLIIGRIQGKAVGGGVGLIAACDYVFAVEAATIRLSELSLGIGPFVIAPVILRKAGQAALNELFMAP
ncbi:enoyl-CoA hydratase/isomerase family protein, partial [Capnocytophaga cynodegmi]|uniref:enoyl-CoA hydratase/isomerase family protein n=1 Tax=Capnocytophaga cynodegmi TaxID=28189 RepID=UPI0005A80DAC